MISVIMPVYNAARIVKRAINSILNQTYSNFEFIIINDGSSDETQTILSAYKDKRIRIISQENRGVTLSLNRGIEASKGNYLARMDADDVALPQRFAKQLEFMEKNPTVAVLGTSTKIIYPDGSFRIRKRPLTTKSIKKNIIRICPFSHSSVMIRRSVLDKVGLYDTSKYVAQDYNLWIRLLSAGYDLANLREPLLIYYWEPESVTRSRTRTKRIKQQLHSRIEAIKLLNLGYSAYLNLIPVVALSLGSQFGLKLDGIFNLLSIGKISEAN